MHILRLASEPPEPVAPYRHPRRGGPSSNGLAQFPAKFTAASGTANLSANLSANFFVWLRRTPDNSEQEPCRHRLRWSDASARAKTTV